MLISSAMNDQINEQIGHEFGASFQYVNIAGYFDSVALLCCRATSCSRPKRSASMR